MDELILYQKEVRNNGLVMQVGDCLRWGQQEGGMGDSCIAAHRLIVKVLWVVNLWVLIAL